MLTTTASSVPAPDNGGTQHPGLPLAEEQLNVMNYGALNGGSDSVNFTQSGSGDSVNITDNGSGDSVNITENGSSDSVNITAGFVGPSLPVADRSDGSEQAERPFKRACRGPDLRCWLCGSSFDPYEKECCREAIVFWLESLMDEQWVDSLEPSHDWHATARIGEADHPGPKGPHTQKHVRQVEARAGVLVEQGKWVKPKVDYVEYGACSKCQKPWRMTVKERNRLAKKVREATDEKPYTFPTSCQPCRQAKRVEREQREARRAEQEQQSLQERIPGEPSWSSDAPEVKEEQVQREDKPLQPEGAALDVPDAAEPKAGPVERWPYKQEDDEGGWDEDAADRGVYDDYEGYVPPRIEAAPPRAPPPLPPRPPRRANPPPRAMERFEEVPPEEPDHVAAEDRPFIPEVADGVGEGQGLIVAEEEVGVGRALGLAFPNLDRAEMINEAGALVVVKEDGEQVDQRIAPVDPVVASILKPPPRPPSAPQPSKPGKVHYHPMRPGEFTEAFGEEWGNAVDRRVVPQSLSMVLSWRDLPDVLKVEVVKWAMDRVGCCLPTVRFDRYRFQVWYKLHPSAIPDPTCDVRPLHHRTVPLKSEAYLASVSCDIFVYKPRRKPWHCFDPVGSQMSAYQQLIGNWKLKAYLPTIRRGSVSMRIFVDQQHVCLSCSESTLRQNLLGVMQSLSVNAPAHVPIMAMMKELLLAWRYTVLHRDLVVDYPIHDWLWGMAV